MILEEFNSFFEKYDFKHYGVRLPDVSFSKKNNLDFLKELALKGHEKIIENFSSEKRKIYNERLFKELALIEELHYEDYILIVWDIVQFCRKNNISTGPSRGSVGGSYLMFTLDVTQLIDPIKYELLFERFISKARAKSKIVDGILYLDHKLLPDVDLDCSDQKRVIEYLYTKYPGKVSRICSLSTLKSRAVVRDICKIVDEKSEEESLEVSDIIPVIFGIPLPLSKCFSENGLLEEKLSPQAKKISARLENLITHRGVHACGILLGHAELGLTTPLEVRDGERISLFNGEWASYLNIKVDILSLSNVSIVDDVCALVGIKKEEIDIDDPKIYDFYQNFKHPKGIFQIEAPATARMAQQIAPKNFSQLSDVIAIVRPGASDFLPEYIANDGQIKSVHPIIDPFLASTNFVLLFQEQLLQCLHAIGFSLEEAEIARRIVGKKKKKEVAEWEKKIFDKCKENKIPEYVAEYIWDVLNKSADYSFNRCLSPDTLVEKEDCLIKMSDIKPGDKIKCFNTKNKEDKFEKVANIFENITELFEIELEDGRKIKASMKHKFLTKKGMMTLEELLITGTPIITDKCNDRYEHSYRSEN